MRLASLLTEDTIIAELKATDKVGIITEMVDRMYDQKLIEDREKAVKAILDREKLGSTGIGSNVAIPHAKHDGIDGLLAAFGKSDAGVDFDAIDGKKVHYIFLLFASKNEAGMHLKTLARISRLFKQKDFCNSLKELSTSKEIMDTIDRAEQEL